MPSGSLRQTGAPPLTPPPVEGRQHMELQTEAYLEELAGGALESTVETQTDPEQYRPPTPFVVPAKAGEDVATQIEDGELSNFGCEVVVLHMLLCVVLVEPPATLSDRFLCTSQRASLSACLSACLPACFAASCMQLPCLLFCITDEKTAGGLLMPRTLIGD
jgi:Radial spoke protein 3